MIISGRGKSRIPVSSALFSCLFLSLSVCLPPCLLLYPYPWLSMFLSLYSRRGLVSLFFSVHQASWASLSPWHTTYFSCLYLHLCVSLSPRSLSACLSPCLLSLSVSLRDSADDCLYLAWRPFGLPVCCSLSLVSGCLSVCLSVCVSVYLPVTLCLSLSVSASLSLCLSLSVSVSLSLFLCLSVSVSLSLCLSLSLSRSLSLSCSRDQILRMRKEDWVFGFVFLPEAPSTGCRLFLCRLLWRSLCLLGLRRRRSGRRPPPAEPREETSCLLTCGLLCCCCCCCRETDRQTSQKRSNACSSSKGSASKAAATAAIPGKSLLSETPAAAAAAAARSSNSSKQQGRTDGVLLLSLGETWA